MTDSELHRIIRDTGDYQAEYIPLPPAQKPEDCNLPDILPGIPSLPPIDPPDIPKLCAPLFIELPIVPEPFVVPENCPLGIQFNAKQVNVYSTLYSTTPIGVVTVGVEQDPDELCSYNLNIPDVVIPCYPTGPQFSGGATITVIDLNKETTDTTTFSITRQDEETCQWLLDGNLTITIPEIPCPAGISFSQSSIEISSTCKKGGGAETKPISIRPSYSNPCRYEVDFPELKIPCYPNGPTVKGDITVKIIDSAEKTKPIIQTAGITQNNQKCCAWDLGGLITIDIPCQSGVTVGGPPPDPQGKIPPIVIPIHQPKRTIGEELVDANPGMNYSVSWKPKKPDPCNIVIEPPPLVVPCSPTGILFKGAIKFTANGEPFPSSPTPAKDRISLADDTSRNPDKPCEWNLDPIVVDIPTPPCPNGFSFYPASGESGVTVKINNTRTLPFVPPSQAEGSQGGDSGSGSGGESGNNGGPITAAPVLWGQAGFGFHNLTLAPHAATPDKKDCGAYLTGTLNLGLPDFIWKCHSFGVSDASGIEVTFDLNQHADTSINLVGSQDGCSFGISPNKFNIPAIICPGGTHITSNVDIYVGNSTTPSSENVITLNKDPNYREGCGLILQGNLRLGTGSVGGAGLGTGWKPQPYPPGTSASIVFPEGARFIYQQVSSTSTSVKPGTPAAARIWEAAASTGEKVFHPYKVITVSENEFPDEGVEAAWEKAVVKVVPRSYLYDVDGETSIDIFGLDYPFTVNPGDKIFLEITIDATGTEPKVAAANIAVGSSWDIDHTKGDKTVKSVEDQPYKILRPAEAAVLYDPTNHSYVNNLVYDYIGITLEEQNVLVEMQEEILKDISQITDGNPRQFKAYALIAQADEGADYSGNPEVTPVDGVTLQYSDEEITLTFNVDQMLSTNLVMVGMNADNVPLLMPQPTAAAKRANRDKDKWNSKLPVPSMPFIKTSNGVSTYVRFTPTLAAPVKTQSGKERNIGTKGTDIQIYYTIDGSSPTINTAENVNCFKYMPNTVLVPTSSGPQIMAGSTGSTFDIYLACVTWGVQWMAISSGFVHSETGFKTLAELTA